MGRAVHPRRLVLSALVLSLLLVPLPPAEASHEPIYKAGVDVLSPGTWEAHFVWLRSPHFNFLGEVWWRALVLDETGRVDVLFFDWDGFQAFREGEPVQPLDEPLYGVESAYGWVSDLSSDLPYFLVLRNPGGSRVKVIWAIFAELDYRRWQGQEPGPTLDTRPIAASPPLEAGEGWTMTFPVPGFYVAHTQPFIDNTALVEVVPAPAPGPVVDVAIRDLGFHPEVIRIPVGSEVRWTNQDQLESTVHVGLLPEDLPPRTPPDPLWTPWLLPATLAGAALAVLALLRRHPRWPLSGLLRRRPPRN